MSPEEQLFHILYDIKVVQDGVPMSEVPKEWGAATKLLAAAVLEKGDEVHITFVGVDGPKAENMKDLDKFRIMVSLAQALAESDDLSPGIKNFCRAFYESVEQVLELRKESKGPKNRMRGLLP